ncbi:hypothetical protein ABB37_00894 [Leptomonas pyrrhocoris]|uniref:Polycystin cation channel PKD1/PKD2 domain-containing protein n=1 Tax=Leptomonas pyrrhocoris TaxID=157538 RepID=A0A0N0E0U2_LEPPY|nr:hypothetical protein ABB37_00894 [Leptomonas pyrrhocoris]KPA86842.1 hypothetical protein ABB37_00894 [Leptomonas pyrrhocoris]|eukprot:XP_015665281.1 hypothetical protein ABB37_00894 [Leptomonas pyrrhocoris]
MVLLHSLLNVGILALLLLFAFQYQVVRNSEVADARHALASYLFASGDRSYVLLHRRIETIDEFVSVLEHTVRAYYAVPTRSRGLFMHYTDLSATRGTNSDVIAPPELYVQYHAGNSGSPAFARILTETYPLTLDNLIGPFTKATALLRSDGESCAPQVDLVAGGTFIPCRVSTIGNLLDRVVQLRLFFSLFSRGRRWPGGGVMTTVPSTWDVVVEYGFEGHKAVMTMTARLSSVSYRQPERGPLLGCWLVMFAALIDLYWRLRTRLKDAAATTGKHPVRRERCSPLTTSSRTPSRTPLDSTEVKENGWRWLGYLSNAIVLAFAATALVAQHRGQTSDSLEEAVTLLLAFAALLSSFRVVVLLKLFPAWYVLIDGLATALAQLFVLAVGVLPVLIGFAVCGTAVFGGLSNNPHFQSVPAAIVTMLCSMFGDNLFNTFVRMDQSPHRLQMYFARFFFVTFMALFVCNILNIAHSIIQDSYSQALKTYADTAAAKAAAAASSSPAQQQFGGGHEDDDDDVEGEKYNDGSGTWKRRKSEEEKICTCSTAARSTSASLSSSHDGERCSVCGLQRQQQRRLPWARRGKSLRAADVERMLRQLRKLSL